MFDQYLSVAYKRGKYGSKKKVVYIHGHGLLWEFKCFVYCDIVNPSLLKTDAISTINNNKCVKLDQAF